MNTIQIPIITDPNEFIAEQYALLSPNWKELTGKEQYDIVSKKFQGINSGTLTVNGEVPSGTPDTQYKKLALFIATEYIYMQSGKNSLVAECLGYKEIFNEDEN